MDKHSLHVLEYSKVIARLSAHTSNAVGREFALELEPLPYPETVLRRLQETREARLLRESDSGVPLGGIYDIRSTVERARIGARLIAREMLEVRYSAESGRRLRQYLLHRTDKAPTLSEMATNLPILQIIEQRIEACISENGEVRDSASPELGRLRSQLKVVSNRLNDRLQSLLTSEKTKTFIQEFVVTVRDGRYCLPVKAEYARAFGGIVHDMSSSGATVFIEPAQTAELGNELKQLQLHEEKEVDRILGELSTMIGSYHEELSRMISILGHLDVIHAKAVLAEEMDANEPKLNRRGIVKLVNARHPLLKGDVVPIDIELGDKFTTLLITGPNTGGKTVALKTLGLHTLMTLAGLQIPANPESEIALFDQIYADIGDEQDIQQSLSTFSAHLKNIVRITETIGSNALVLMDEVGSGTDPSEGAALAKALLDYLMRKGARVVATTHYGELKEYAYARPGVENASVEFDKETLSPTYRILLGVPGMSNALYIAGRIGLREDIIEDAREFLDRREIETGELLGQIEKSKKATFAAERDAKQAKEEAEKLREEYSRRVNEVANVQRTVKQEAQMEARDILRRAQEKSENIVKELQRMQQGIRKGPDVRGRLNALRNETYNALSPGDATPAETLAPVDPNHVYRNGDRVRVVTLGIDGQLLENPRDGTVAVQMGAMRATLPLEQLRPLKKAEAAEIERKETKSAKSASTATSEIVLRKAMQIAPELQLRALRADEAQSLLDKYMDDAYAAGMAQVRIVHGKGTGALRKVVHDFLTGHSAVSNFRLAPENEGGDGATIVALKR